MPDAVAEIAVEEWNAMRERARQHPATSDDVWITAAGDRLDTPEKLLAFLRNYSTLDRGAPRTAS